RLVAEEREDPAEVVAHQGFAVGQLLALDAGQRDLDQSAELIPPASRVERCEKYPGKRRAQRRTVPFQPGGLPSGRDQVVHLGGQPTADLSIVGQRNTRMGERLWHESGT